MMIVRNFMSDRQKRRRDPQPAPYSAFVQVCCPARPRLVGVISEGDTPANARVSAWHMRALAEFKPTKVQG